MLLLGPAAELDHRRAFADTKKFLGGSYVLGPEVSHLPRPVFVREQLMRWLAEETGDAPRPPRFPPEGKILARRSDTKDAILLDHVLYNLTEAANLRTARRHRPTQRCRAGCDDAARPRETLLRLTCMTAGGAREDRIVVAEL